MGGMAFGLVVEGAVAILLMLTIGYCYVLNVRLKRLHADRDALRAMITDLVRATDMANGAIQGMKQTAAEADGQLRARLQEAEGFSTEMGQQVQAGQALLQKISQIAKTARDAEAQKGGMSHYTAPPMAPQSTEPKDPATPRARNALSQLDKYTRSKGEAA
jgi:ABC-type transporter Mla subunit MlaD